MQMLISSRPRLAAIGLGALCCLAAPTNLSVNAVWGAPVSVAPTPTVSIVPSVLRTTDIEKEPVLQVKVSFEAKAQPLSELLLELQKQSHITLLASPGSPASSVRVTAYIQELPLSQVLQGFSRLYGVRWSKSQGNATAVPTFTMLPCDRNELEQGVLKLGNWSELRGRFITSLRYSPDHLNWSQEVTKYVDEKDLRFGDSPSVSLLPADLLSKIRREKESQAALELLEMQSTALEANIDDEVLYVEVPNKKEPQNTTQTNGAANGQGAPQANGVPDSSAPRVEVRTRQGQIVASLSNMVPPKPTIPSQSQKPVKKPTPPIGNEPVRNIPGPT